MSYRAIHGWVKAHKGKADHCEFCDKPAKRFNWANKNHDYKRNLDDYISLCASCHKYYDLKNNPKH